MGLLDNLRSFFKKGNGEEISDKTPSDKPSLEGKVNDNETKNKTKEKLIDTYKTKFNNDSPAYRFTNEPLGDFLHTPVNLEGPVLTITSSGDPICLFAGMGAKEIYAADISTKANAWAEYKWQGFRLLGYDEFHKSFVENSATWKDFPFHLPVSEHARKVFSKVRKSSKRLIETTKIFWDQGYAASHATSAAYTSEKYFEAMQKKAQDTVTQFYLADFTEFFEQEDAPPHFTAIYISNVLDHIKNPKTGKHDFSIERMGPLVGSLVDHLTDDGQILLNLQWGNRAKAGTEASLQERGLRLRKIDGHYNDCGSMYIAER